MNKRLKGKIFSVYLDEITKARLQALSEEMSLSRSAILRMLVGEKWTQRRDQFLSAVKAFDEAKAKQETALIPRGVDPAAPIALCAGEK